MSAAPRIRSVCTDEAELPGGPYSQAIVSGSQVYISGQTGTDPVTGRLVEGGVLSEARQVLKNLHRVLAACGCKPSDVVKATIFLVDFDRLREMNAIYAAYFAPPLPARSTIGVTRLANDAQIEIELYAVRPTGADLLLSCIVIP